MPQERLPPRHRVLSGIQPTGKPHLGNYFGAIQQHIADYHALTTMHDADEVRRNTFEIAATYLAFGLDPSRAVFFRQSDVAEVTELTWILSTVAGMGLLERAHSYKDKVSRGITPTVGLFLYPVLMAADILIYKSTVVPVGQDQIQHVEITRDIAGSFNATFREVFPLPDHRLSEAPKVPGTDGAKMSKSYDNTIELTLAGKPLRKKVMSIVTDSKTVEEPKDPATCTVFTLYSLLASEKERQELADLYRKGGLGYGQAKEVLLEKIEDTFADFRMRYAKIVADPSTVEEILRTGAMRARSVAAQTLAEVRAAVGFRA
jgi:tryptophanyl-tRNA synthetase